MCAKGIKTTLYVQNENVNLLVWSLKKSSVVRGTYCFSSHSFRLNWTWTHSPYLFLTRGEFFLPLNQSQHLSCNSVSPSWCYCQLFAHVTITRWQSSKNEWRFNADWRPGWFVSLERAHHLMQDMCWGRNWGYQRSEHCLKVLLLMGERSNCDPPVA